MEPISDPRVLTLINDHEFEWFYERVPEPQHAQDSHEWPLSLAEREGVWYAAA